jgi:hypothetical protein
MTGIAEPNRSADLRDLEDHYGSYCRAMRMLVLEGKSLKKVQSTVCWKRLALLHDCRPARYLEPDALYLKLCRERSGDSTTPRRQ